MQYVQYAIVDTNPIKAGVSITKGHVNTVDANGYLIALTASAGAADNLNVVFQAMASSAAVSGEADSTVQVLRQRSRILMKAPVNVTPGDDVVVVGAVVTPDTVAVGTTNLIGTVYEIVTLSASRARKAKTEAGDLVLVDTV